MNGFARILGISRNILKEYRGIVRNFMALSFLQATNLLVPLLLIPLLIERVGIAQYGVIALAQSTMMYFYVWVDYGFSLSAVKALSLKNQMKEDFSQLFFEVSLTKICLLLIGFLILYLFIPLHPTMLHHRDLFLGSYLLVAGQALLPVWFFQGVEKMPWITYFNFISKSISAFLIFTFVHDSFAGIWVNIILGGSNILIGLLANIYIIQKYRLNFRIHWIKGIPKQIHEGFYYFSSHFSASLYMHSGTLVLGWFVNDQMLGVYSVAEKIALLLRQVLVMFSQAIYTKLCAILIEGYEAMQSFLKKLFLPFCILIGIGCVGCWCLAPLMSRMIKLAPNERLLFVHLVKCMAFIPILVGVNIPFYQLLLISDRGKSATKILLAGAFLCILLNIILLPFLSVIGTALSLLVTESLISIVVILKAKKHYSSLFSKS